MQMSEYFLSVFNAIAISLDQLTLLQSRLENNCKYATEIKKIQVCNYDGSLIL